MDTLTILGAEMLPNELTLLKFIVGIGFIGWMMILFVQAVWLDGFPVAKSGLDEDGCHYSKKHGGYHCVTGRFCGKIFTGKEEMLKLAAKPVDFQEMLVIQWKVRFPKRGSV
jgi:hypothetical protein